MKNQTTKHSNTARRIAGIFFVALALAGCAAREIPINNAAGADEMKRSPCACAQIDYTAPQPRWLG